MAAGNSKTKTNAPGPVVAQRVAQLYELRLSGAEFADVQAFAEAQGWGVKRRMLFKYIKKADDLIESELEPDRDKARRRHLRQRRMLFSRCMRIQDYKAALAVLKDEAALAALYPATKLEHTGKDGAPLAVASLTAEEFTDAQLAAIVAAGVGAGSAAGSAAGRRSRTAAQAGRAAPAR